MEVKAYLPLSIRVGTERNRRKRTRTMPAPCLAAQNSYYLKNRDSGTGGVLCMSSLGHLALQCNYFSAKSYENATIYQTDLRHLEVQYHFQESALGEKERAHLKRQNESHH